MSHKTKILSNDLFYFKKKNLYLFIHLFIKENVVININIKLILFS